MLEKAGTNHPHQAVEVNIPSNGQLGTAFHI